MSMMSTQKKGTLVMDKKIYTGVKDLSTVGGATIGAIYFLASLIVNLPNVSLVLGVILCIMVASSVLLYFISRRFNMYDGEMDVVEKDGVKTFSLVLSTDPDDLINQKVVAFKVCK